MDTCFLLRKAAVAGGIRGLFEGGPVRVCCGSTLTVRAAWAWLWDGGAKSFVRLVTEAAVAEPFFDFANQGPALDDGQARI